MQRRYTPKPVKKMRSIAQWRSIMQGEPAFVIGNGCSANDLPLHLVHDYFTIGINRAFRLFDPVVLFWQDQCLFDDQIDREGVDKSTAVKVCRDVANCRQYPNTFRLRPHDAFRLPDTPHVLFGKGATGPLAIQFAYALGCSPIVLIGFDCQYREGKTDFYGVNRFHKPTTLPNCMSGLQWAKRASKQHPIINCSDNTVWENSEPLDRVVANLPPAKGRQYYIDRLNQSLL